MTIEYFRAPVAEMSPAVLYRVLWLRVHVFVVEQQAAYPEIDGRDIEPGAELLWAADGDDVLATLRILTDADGLRIGRVATAPQARGRGLAADLMRQAVQRCVSLDPAATIRLDAQLQLEDWYARFGFRTSGPTYVEDGIPHIPMEQVPE
ncbi:GNAT family N-acetyltransferase [Microbacterium sp. CJ88]|uniref:GNAT family N-acetyltransferase n=1 Tax=Microbacterium sp. CJ88 TaxID=3445672 RepID=UPI003F660632